MKEHAILLMDDDPHVARTFTKVLNGSNHRLLTAATLGEAFRILGEHGPEIDLVITELEPRFHGMVLLSAIQTACKNLPVVVLTWQGDWNVYAAALKHGAAEFLNKPISDGELRAMVERFCPRLCSCPHAASLAMAA